LDNNFIYLLVGAVESNEEWEALFGAATDADGRVTSATFPPIAAGTWKLRFDTSAYFQRIGVAVRRLSHRLGNVR
jgi:5-hydroxyisourate hydrolase-like protein (transthyretin family)